MDRHDSDNRRWVPRGVRLLDAAPELAAGLPPQEIEQAREHAILPTAALDPGSWQPDQLADINGVRGKIHGFLILSGDLTMNLTHAGRTCTRMITPSELMLLDGWEDTSMPMTWGWTILTPTTLAILDDRLVTIAQRWPHLMIAILKHGAQQLRHALLQQSISQLPRVEDRLLALMWSIADRQGTVGADGIHIKIDATHQTVANMIGARRPTVSLGLSALHDADLLRATPDGWVINPDSLDTLTHRTAARTAPAQPALCSAGPSDEAQTA